MNLTKSHVQNIVSLGKSSSIVCDIGIKKNPHTFFANGVLVHNSIFFPLSEMIEKRFPGTDKNNVEDFSNKSIEICSEVQSVLNRSFDLFAKKFLNVENHKFDIKQEIIARSGIWTSKKRYALWIVNENTVPKNEILEKGIDTVRSNFPKVFKNFLKEILVDILKFVDREIIDSKIIEFKKTVNSFEIKDIAIPSGINGTKKYRRIKEDRNKKIGNWIKGAPVHVKSAIAYNELLSFFDIDSKYPPISDGEKIKWVYLKDNPYGLDTVAFKGYDDPPQIMEFVEKFTDKQKIFDRMFESKLEKFYESMNRQLPSVSRRIVNKYFKFE